MTIKEMCEAIWDSLTGCIYPNHKTGWKVCDDDTGSILYPKKGNKYR